MTDQSFTPVQVAAFMRASTDAIVAEVRALGDLARVRPAPEEWCANEVVGHLFEADRRGFVGRVMAVLTADGVVFETWEQTDVAAARRDDERLPASLLADFLAAREVAITFVAGIDPVLAMSRSGMHPVVGELTIGNLLHEWVHHDRNHLGQLIEVTRSFAWPGMGNSRNFTAPEF